MSEPRGEGAPGTPPEGKTAGAASGAGRGPRVPRYRIGDSKRTPLLALLLALGAVFWFGQSRDGFFRPPASDGPGFRTLARAANASPANGFVGFERRTLEPEGKVVFERADRAPSRGVFLVALAIAPFADDLAAQMYAARGLMLLFFFGAALTAYCALRRLLADRFLALGATLLSFSSWYWHSADLVESGGSPEVFGLLLAFHGLVVFHREGRLRPLLLRAGVALLLGWQVLALLLPFVLLGFLAAARRGFREGAPGGGGRRASLRAGLAAGLRSPAAAFALFALLCGGLLHGVDSVRESLAPPGGVVPAEPLPGPALRFGVGTLESVGEYEASRASGPRGTGGAGWFLARGAERIGRMVLPQALPGFAGVAERRPDEPFDGAGAFLGVLATLAGLLFASSVPGAALPLSALTLSGLVGALALPAPAAVEDFESLALVGIPLTCYTLGLAFVKRRAGDRWVRRAAGAALVVFLWSHHHLAEAGYDEFRFRRQDAVRADFEAIRRITEGKIVFVPEAPFHGSEFGGRSAPHFYLAGSIVVDRPEHRARADFRLSDELLPGARVLTPDNLEVFLYHQGDLEGFVERAGPPRLRSFFEVHLGADWLVYVREPCAPEDREPRFFLHVTPERPEDLPEARRSSRFDNLDFDFADRVLESGERCVAAVYLPGYPIRSVVTGQFVRRGDGSYENLWRGEFAVGAGGDSDDGDRRAP